MVYLIYIYLICLYILYIYPICLIHLIYLTGLSDLPIPSIRSIWSIYVIFLRSIWYLWSIYPICMVYLICVIYLICPTCGTWRSTPAVALHISGLNTSVVVVLVPSSRLLLLSRYATGSHGVWSEQARGSRRGSGLGAHPRLGQRTWGVASEREPLIGWHGFISWLIWVIGWLIDYFTRSLVDSSISW